MCKAIFFRRTLVSVLALLTMLSLTATLAPAQTTTTGSIAGSVTDPSGAIVPNAKVSLKDLDRGAEQETQTNKEGAYRFDLLLPGNYSVTAAAASFQTVMRQVPVLVGQVGTGDFQLKLGAATETVTVTAQAPLVQVEDGNLSATINEKQAANIPNPGNDLTYMAQIAPGSVMNTGGGGAGNFSSYGISAVANLFTLNGMDANDPFFNTNNSGATNLTLGQNEVEEVAVVTNGYSGQYVGLAGANVNYVTRGGTNDFHGRATWFWNGRALNANSWFHNATHASRSFVNANQYAADVGGPIVKEKLFFYANFEGLYLVIPTSTQAIVPSAQFATAVQTNINALFPSDTAIQQFYQNMLTLYRKAPGINREADTLNDHGCDGSESLMNTSTNGNTFGTFDPINNPLGAGTPCATTFFSNVGNKTHDHLEAYRIDWNVTSHDRFFSRIQKDRGLQATVTDVINPLFNIQSDQPEWQGQALESHVFSGGRVNQVLVSGQWYSSTFENANPKATQAAFPTTLFFPSGQLSDAGGVDALVPKGRRVTQFQASDDFSQTRGSHTFKAGGKFRRNWISNADYGIFSTGAISVSTLDAFFSGGSDPMPSNAISNFSSMTQSFPKSLEQPFAVYSLGGYFEDDWKIKPNLTLTLAFRLDHPSNPVCFHNCFVRPATNFPLLSTDPTTPYNQLLLVNQRQMLPDLTSVEPQPRLGFAWEPHFWGMHNTVIRGGVGLFYDTFPGALVDGFSENPPNDPTFTVFSCVPDLSFTSCMPVSTISPPSDSSSLFASAAASNTAFQNGFTSSGSFNSISASMPPGVAFSAPNLAASVDHPKIPQYQKWSAEVERQFGQNTSIVLRYVGNHAIHIYTQNSGINGCNNTGTFANLPACNGTSFVGVNPNFLSVDYAESIGVSNYNGLTASFTHRYRSGLVQLNYSWSHAMDTVSNSGIPIDAFENSSNSSIVFPENPANPRQFNYASSDYDARHILNANYVWELPVKRFISRGHGPDRLLRGWDVNGAVFFRTGFPFTLVDSTTSGFLQAGGYGSSNSFVQVFGTQVAPGGTGVNCQVAAKIAANGGTPAPQPNQGICLAPTAAQFNPNPAFASSPNGFGNVGRNTIRGPHYWNTDFSLVKHTKLAGERGPEFVFGAQFFNVFNHPNFNAPVTNVANIASFGQITGTVSSPTTLFGSGLGADASPRLIQLKLQLSF